MPTEDAARVRTVAVRLGKPGWLGRSWRRTLKDNVGQNNVIKNGFVAVSPRYGGYAYKGLSVALNLTNAWSVGTQLAAEQSVLPWHPIFREAMATPKPIGQLTVIENPGGYSESEIGAAKLLTKRGNRVVLRPPDNVNPTSDLLVNGVKYDVYTPKSININRIISEMAGKNRQTIGIVLDLSQTSLNTNQFYDALARVQGAIRAGGGTVNIQDIIVIGGL